MAASPKGPDGYFKVFDTYVAWTATPALSFGLDVNYVTNEVNKADDALALQGTGVYARYQVSSPAALSVRYERLDDEGLFGGIDQVLHEAHRHRRIQAGRRLPGARRVPARLVEPALLHRPAARRPARPPEHGAHRPGVVVRQQAGSVVTAMADLVFVGLSILFFVLGAGYVAACRHLAPGGRS